MLADVSTWDHTITLALLRQMNTARPGLLILWRSFLPVPAVLVLMEVASSLARDIHIYVFAYLWANLLIKLGTTTLHTELEECVADFVGKPAALVTGMGYATNSAILPSLIGKVLLNAHSICNRHIASNSELSHLIWLSTGRFDNQWFSKPQLYSKWC